MRAIHTFSALCLLNTSALAEVTMEFIEGAPKDRFTIVNAGACPLGGTKISIDLKGSAAGLVFDVSSEGAGVEVFQPFELTSGGGFVVAQPNVSDGDQELEIQLSQFLPGETVSFTIDVDDTVSNRQITVSNAEIFGASFTVTTDTGRASGEFAGDARASARLSTCTS
ncbi:MAG: aggregation factor core [Pseudomonadota bacterium]